MASELLPGPENRGLRLKGPWQLAVLPLPDTDPHPWRAAPANRKRGPFSRSLLKQKQVGPHQPLRPPFPPSVSSLAPLPSSTALATLASAPARSAAHTLTLTSPSLGSAGPRPTPMIRFAISALAVRDPHPLSCPAGLVCVISFSPPNFLYYKTCHVPIRLSSSTGSPQRAENLSCVVP